MLSVVAGCAGCSGKGASCSGRVERWEDCSVHCPAIWTAVRTGCFGQFPAVLESVVGKDCFVCRHIV